MLGVANYTCLLFLFDEIVTCVRIILQKSEIKKNKNRVFIKNKNKVALPGYP
jgi:hypothetical protein